MNKLIFSALFLLGTTVAIAQHEPCKTMHRHQTLLENDAAYKIAFQSRQTETKTDPKAKTMAGGVYKIPVVVHILHLGTAVGVGANISDEQVYSAIQSLNNAYRKIPGTKGFGGGADAEMEFCLAQKNPSGVAHSGINRINASSTSTYASEGITDDNESTLKALSKWDNTKYYNIWLVTEIDDNNGDFGTQGYAYFPGTAATYDGAVILANTFGFDEDGSKGFNLKSYTRLNTTSIHELGHAFDLYHTFQGDDPDNDGMNIVCPANTSCGNSSDCVADTPPHKRSSDDCVIGSNSCTGTSTEFFIHNYMDYSGEECQNQFTAGQAARMRASLSTGSRASLVSAANLAACGCSGNAAPITRFSASPTQSCEGIPVQFKDESIDFPASWAWSFPGGTPSSSTVQNPSVSYSGTGPYSVTLVTTSTGGFSKSVTKSSLISTTPVVSTPFSENFESGNMPPTGWDLQSSDDLSSEITWDITSSSGNGASTKSASVNCYDYNSRGETDDLITPPIDLLGISSPALTFNVSYDQYISSATPPVAYDDGLEVAISTDCGVTWTNVYSKYGAALETSSSRGSGTNPSVAGHWRSESVSLSSFNGSNIKVRFRCVNDFGADLFLDDILIQGTGYDNPVANFIASDTVVLTNGAINFTDLSSGHINTYSWDFGTDASLSAGTTGKGPHTVSYSSNGYKTVTLTVTNPESESDTETKVAYINVQADFAPPVADFTADNTTPFVNGVVVFTSTSTGPISSYSWNFGTDASASPGTSGAGPHSITYSSPGVKTVVLTVTNPDNESDTKTKTSYIEVMTTTDTKEMAAVQKPSLYPNPAGRFVQLKNIPIGAKISFINQVGTVVKTEQNNNSGEQKIELGDFAAGMYTVVVQTEEMVYAEKLIVQP